MIGIRTAFSWFLCALMFATLGASSLSAVAVVVRIVRTQQFLASWAWTGIYWLMVSHLLFAVSFWLQPAVYGGRLIIFARFFKAKSIVGVLIIIYVSAFLYMFLSPRTS